MRNARLLKRWFRRQQIKWHRCKFRLLFLCFPFTSAAGPGSAEATNNKKKEQSRINGARLLKSITRYRLKEVQREFVSLAIPFFLTTATLLLLQYNQRVYIVYSR